MSQYFGSNTKRGEIAELREELNSRESYTKKDAVKKVIAAMTVGKDVSMLFTDVLKCMITNDLELKKLVYLYLMNYAKSQPDLAILAVNSFVKDTHDSNPLIRALAIRTMSSIRVEEIVNYLCEPLRKSIKDEDPYVRKTAAICVAKLHEMDAALVDDQGFLDDLRDMLADSNPMVVANAVAALTEIATINPSVFELNDATLQKLLAAINECTEWGQIFILDSLASYTPRDSKEAESIIDRISARLSHANSGVVLSSVKVILRLIDYIDDMDYVNAMLKKMAPSLVTLLNAEFEVQYVALRNIIIILQKQPQLLADRDIRVFICKYNDPIYVKMEKLEIMIMLANDSNIAQVLQEFKDSAQEVDVDFVRKAVRAIGRCAIKLENAADRCINVLLDLIQTKVSYVVQEAIVVIKDIFRKYPNRYESVIGALCENLDTLDEPDAKASLFWIIGEYADRIDNADEILEQFCETFMEEPADVQLQLLTAVVKLFIAMPEESQELMRKVLGMATQADNPDLRDRGFVYWRLLTGDSASARDIVMAEKPVISGESVPIEKALLDTLVANIGTLASVFHKPPNAFVSKLKLAVPKSAAPIPTSDTDLVGAVAKVAIHEEDDGVVKASSNTGVDDLLSDLGIQTVSAPTPAPVAAAPSLGGTGLEDLMGGPVRVSAPPASLGSGLIDIASPTPVASAPVPQSAVKQVELIDVQKGKGMSLHGAFARGADGIPVFHMTVYNKGSAALSEFLVQFNTNTFGLAPVNTKVNMQPATVLPGGAAQGSVQCSTNGQRAPNVSNKIQVAVKVNADVFYFEAKAQLDVFTLSGVMEKQAFLAEWRSIADSGEQSHVVSNCATTDPAAVQARLQARNVCFVARPRPVDNTDVSYYSVKLVNGVNLLVEVTLTPSSRNASIAVKTADPRFAPFAFELLDDILH